MSKFIVVKIFFFIVFSFIYLTLSAQLWVPLIFSDQMILQQNTNVAVWGETTPNKKVFIKTSWNKKTYRTIASDDGRWIIKIQTPIAS